jgi:hepatocyte growth factor-regulated tyrosine kinase substrate
MHPRWRSQPMNAYHTPTPAMNGGTGGLQPQWTGSTQISAEAPQATWYPAQQQAQQQAPYSPTMSVKSPQPVTGPPYLEATPYQYAAPTPTPSQPVTMYRQVPMQHHSTSGPVAAAPSPAVAPYDLAAPASPYFSSSLTRSHTTSSTYSPASTSAQHSRSNTISHAIGRAQVQQQHFRNQSVPQHPHVASPLAPAAPVAPALPHFPSAPTALPQTLPTFGSSIPAREERKEALLIEL